MGVRLAGRFDHLSVARVQPAVANVLEEAAVEQVRILGNQAQLRVQRLLGERADVPPVHQDLPALRVVQAQDETHESRFARPGIAHQADALSSRNRHVEAPEDRLVRRVGEGNVA